MAKRSTDLLEVFNRKSSDRQGGTRRRSTRGGAKRRTSRDFSGMFLGPRQLLLACCVLLLLLVLTFVVGIGVGRRGGEELSDGTRLRRETADRLSAEAWYVCGRLRQMDEVRGEPIDPARIPDHLGLSRRHVNVEGAPRGHWDVFLGPFATEAAARHYWQEANLETRGRKIGYPFSIPGFVRRPRFP